MPNSRMAIVLGACIAGHAWAPALAADGIYTCVDAKGRRLSSDRPIAECMDREQQERTSSGTVRRIIRPPLTAEEAAIEEERARKAAEEAARVEEKKRRERAMLARYPDRSTHDRERAGALGTVEDVLTVAGKRMQELEVQQKKLQVQANFYKDKGEQDKLPAALKRQIDENLQAIAGQKRFIANQEQEKQRINQRFDSELRQLESLWAQVRGIQPVPGLVSAPPPPYAPARP